LKALGVKMAQENFILTESQLAALERVKEKKEACGENRDRASRVSGSAEYLLCRKY
jgi:hypothetical protein